MKTKLIVLTTLLIIISKGYSQKEKDSLLTIWENTKLVDSLRANAYNQYIRKKYFESKKDSAYAMTLNLVDFINAHQLKKQKADALILLGNLEHYFDDGSKAAKNFSDALKLYKELNDKKGQAIALHSIGNSYRRVFQLDEAKNYYEKSLALSTKLKDTALIAKCYLGIGNIFGWRYKTENAKEFYQKSLKLNQLINNKNDEAISLLNMGSVYIQIKEFEKANSYIQHAIQLGDSTKSYNILYQAYTVLGTSYFQQKEYDKIIEPASNSLKYAELISKEEGIDNAYYLLYEAYKGKRDFDSTMKYHTLRKKRNSIADIKTLNTLEKFKIDNIRLQDSLVNANNEIKSKLTHQKEKTNLTLAWGGSLSAVSLFAFLIFRNSKRKQRKAEQERQQQIEEKEKILKDFELSTIDAMIEGQEKERQRLASDLHDNVGATLSAAKLQFNYLMKPENDLNTSEELVKKTRSLLEDAYAQIRSLAHLKNSGVMAKDGLLPAIEKLAQNASGVNGLSFQIKSFGLEHRLEGSLEISIFRIIQELVTNIIKHASASEGTIHLTNHENNLNIIVEDNGIGFDQKLVKKNSSGMGIDSIEKRLTYLNGTLVIESEKNRGTTVIIDIPI
jgi:signal transduction histidine kinase